MPARPGGFTTIEILLVLVMMLLLSSILFPLFAQARDNTRQTSCLSNQRTISMAVLAFAQDHAGILPNTDVWSAVPVTPSELICPAAPSLRNGYVYNSMVANTSLSSLHNSRTNLLLADGMHVASPDSNSMDNIAYTVNDIRFRHGESLVAAFVDGHAEVISDARDLPVEFRAGTAAEFVGYDTTTGGLWVNAQGKPKFGRHGYVLPHWNDADPAVLGLDGSYVANVAATGVVGMTWAPAPCNDFRAIANPKTYGTQAASCWANDGAYTITLNNPTDAAIHTLRIYCVDWDHQHRTMRITVRGLDNAPLIRQTVPVSEFDAGVWLTFRFRGNIVVQTTHTEGPNAVVSAFVFD